MIGRGSIGCPWIFKDVKHYLQTGEEPFPLSFGEKIQILREEILSSVARLDERRGIIHIRRHLASTPLFKGIPNFRDTRIAMLRTESVEELFRIFGEVEDKYSNEISSPTY
jgi:tRNA-dihydrouridine synthase